MKKITLSAISISLIMTLTACAGSSYRPIVDTYGQDMSRYEEDLRQCQELAKQVDTASTTVASAGISAAIGAAIGAIVGNSSTVGQGAAIGAITGGTSGGLSGNEKQKHIIQQCLSNRGYRVLG